MGSVGRIPTADNQDEVQSVFFRIFHQFGDGVLSFLCCIANGIKFHVVLIDFCGSVFLHHCLLKELPNRFGFLLVHGRLVGKTDLFQHGIGVKSFTNSLGEVLEEFLLVSTVDNVIGDHFRFFHVFDADVIFAETSGRYRLFVTELAMDDTSETLALMHIDGIPDLGYPGTCSIDNFHILFIQHFHFFIRGPKCWQNDDVSFFNGGKVLLSFSHLFNQINLHFCQTIVNFGVVNEFVGNVQFPIGIMLHGFVRQGDTPFDAPTEPKVLGQVDLDVGILVFDHVIGCL
mmetsp:Transcript_3120/g.5637  ORF Transcript_3120/g.5637 Transcript_3120/m.5637 type:complete len:287 (+) Transcript_3120:1566-2426(+)